MFKKSKYLCRRNYIFLVFLLVAAVFLFTPAFGFATGQFLEKPDRKSLISVYSKLMPGFFGREDQVENEAFQYQYGLAYSRVDGIKLMVTKEVPVQIKVDGQILVTNATLPPVESILEEAGVELGENDRVKADLVKDNQEEVYIEVVRVEEKLITKQVPVAYKTERVNDPNLADGKQEVRREGVKGEKIQMFRVTYQNGEEVNRELEREVLTKKPVNRLIAHGATQTGGNFRGGLDLAIKKEYEMVATAYTYTGRPTATGVRPYVGGVAVDPKVIPLGSWLYVEGYGMARAVDTGGLIKGERVDVFFETAEECYQWGKRKTKVYLLD